MTKVSINRVKNVEFFKTNLVITFLILNKKVYIFYIHLKDIHELLNISSFQVIGITGNETAVESILCKFLYSLLAILDL